MAPQTHAPRAAAALLSLAVCACAPVAAEDARSAAADPTRITDDDVPPSAAAARGRDVYDRWCVGCHGDLGRGDGPAAVFLDPLPRDFRSGRFKFRSTPSGELPTKDDLVRTITNGLKGSSMPAFPLVPEPQRRDVAEYVLHVAQLGRAQVEADLYRQEDGLSVETVRAEKMDDIRDALAARLDRARPIGIPPEPPSDDASVERGRTLYAELCLSCHGATGIGDGPSSWALRDARDAPIRPRDFTVGVLRGGDSPQDLFRRMRTGLDGTPMPAFSNSDEALWDVVHYVRTLRRAGPAEEVR